MIRRAATGDVGLVMAISRAAFAESAAFPYPSSALRETWDDIEAAVATGTFLLIEKGRAVGACRFRLHQQALVFARLCVLPARRRKGHASDLLGAIQAHALTAACMRVECSARSAFPDNRPFYQRRGYEVVGYEDVYGVKNLRTNLVLKLA